MKGKILIAKPYLGDPNFDQSVVLICEHSEEGAFGLVLNQITENVLSDFFDDLALDHPMYLGGPVENNTLHYLHKRGDLIEHSVKLKDGLYWSGNFDQIKMYLQSGIMKETDIKFFLGYSGWDAHQLDEEIKDEVWVVSNASAELVFDEEPQKIWRKVLRNLGGNYIIMANSPADPRLN